MLARRADAAAACTCACRRLISSSSTLRSLPKPVRKSDWKRRQEGSNFVDTLSITCSSGHGGAGGVAFHREKYKEKGPPSGGNGGQGGSVYLLASTSVSSLSHLTKNIRAGAGGAGGGKWLAGKRGEDVYVQVPVGTVVKERRADPSKDGELVDDEDEEMSAKELLQLAYRANKTRLVEAEKRVRRWNEWKKAKVATMRAGGKAEPFQEQDLIELAPEQQTALERMRKTLFVMYPGTDLEGHVPFLRSENELLEKMMARHDMLPIRGRRRRRYRSLVEAPPIELDLDRPTLASEAVLIAKGGRPGFGNPTFHSMDDRSPKYATRGGPGEVVRLELELKSAGEVGLVGMPNAGKSTLLRALTSSTPRVASYAFTTLNPHHGTCILYDDGSFSGAHETIDDTEHLPEELSAESAEALGERRMAQRMSNRARRDRTETLRFTLTDNPGLVARSAENVGLGHAFLRHVERCSAIVYVVDLSLPDPVASLETIRRELELYADSKDIPSLVGRAKGVIANKADLFETEEAGQVAKQKLAAVRQAVAEIEKAEIEEGQREDGDSMWVVAASAREQYNLPAVVRRLAETVRTERERRAFDDEQRRAEEAAEEEEAAA